MKKIIVGAGVFSLIMPVFAFAALENLMNLLVQSGQLIRVAVGIIVVLAILAFFWGLVKYLFDLGSGGKSDGKQLMIWGIIAIAVMASVWGLVAFLQQTFGIQANQPSQTIDLPRVNGGTF